MASYKVLTPLRFAAGAKNVEAAQKGDMDAVSKWTEFAPGDVTDKLPPSVAKAYVELGAVESVHGKPETEPAEEVADDGIH